MARAPIQDQYTAQIANKTISRQLAYQLRHKAKKLCIKCDHPAISGPHCLSHAVKAREYQRLRYDCDRENQCKSRRLEHALKPPPLDQLPPA